MDAVFENGVKAFDEGAAAESLQSRARRNDRYGGSFAGPGDAPGGMLFFQFNQMMDEVPPYSHYPARRDAYLRRTWKTEPMIAGGVYTQTARIGTLDYMFEGGRNQKSYYQRIAGEAHFGQGNKVLTELTLIDLLTQDNGAFWEVLGPGDPAGPLVGRVAGIAHLDSAQCWRTFDPEYPVIYSNPEDGKWHRLHWTRVVTFANMPQPDELARGIGFCAVSRALELVRTMKVIQRYKREKVTGTVPAIAYGNGLKRDDFDTAVQIAEAKADAKGMLVWKGIPVLLSPHKDPVNMGLLSLAGLPDSFDFETDMTLYIYGLALAFGVDAREFWPGTASGATKADATVQHMKAKGKGIGDLIATIERAWNWRILPYGVTFKYDYTDDEQDLLTAQIQQTRVTTYTGIRSQGAMNAKQMELHLVRDGILDPTLMELGALTPDPAPAQPDPTPPASNLEDAQPGDETGELGTEAKQYSDVRAAFVERLTELFEATDDLTRRQLAGALRSTLREAGLQAFNEGLAAGGAASESLSQKELKAFRDWQTAQSGYVTDLGSALYKDGVGISDARAKAEMWARRSLDEVRFEGEKLAAPLIRKKWVLNARHATKEPCDDCRRLDGQVHTVKEWDASGYTPYSGKTACKSFQCGCDFVDTTEPVSGGF